MNYMHKSHMYFTHKLLILLQFKWYLIALNYWKSINYSPEYLSLVWYLTAHNQVVPGSSPGGTTGNNLAIWAGFFYACSFIPWISFLWIIFMNKKCRKKSALTLYKPKLLSLWVTKISISSYTQRYVVTNI